LDDPVTARTPIIFLSAAYSDEQHSFKGYEQGAVDYIVKPFDPAILLRKVNVFLELARYRIQLEHLVKDRTSALEEEERKLRSIVENTPDCILNIGQDGIISFINAPNAI
jgi:DNA-binding response OmpR family regulator